MSRQATSPPRRQRFKTATAMNERITVSLVADRTIGNGCGLLHTFTASLHEQGSAVTRVRLVTCVRNDPPLLGKDL
jgi:hypothetical protein